LTVFRQDIYTDDNRENFTAEIMFRNYLRTY